MRVHVDEEKCQGHTLCNGIAPALFGLRDDDGHAFVLVDEVPAGSEDLAHRAVLGCPEGAIHVSE